ncbi:MAG TPA: PrsW family glutamic-type intramembrane protease [Steroidobacteraceae bacterium]|jgi:RsiW-degrading membrane proteinase PrsW (M82 family)|nr:PrsW family glutamic-type intramembrane protease [Steroidobacteraceae bacterium]
MANELSASAGGAGFQLSRSMVFPLVGGRRTWSQEHLLPIIATILVSLGMMVALQPDVQPAGVGQIQQAWAVYWIIALYIALMINTYIYHMCERAAPWWLIPGVAAFTFLLMASPFFNYWAALFDREGMHWRHSPYYVVQLAGWYVVGLCEEAFKALPLFALILLGAGLTYLGRRAPGRLGAVHAGLAKHVRISGPLDGMILGVASGTGFFLYETPVIYLPRLMGTAHDSGSQAFNGLVALLGRGLPTLTGHCAYSGLFGYFIGLSVLRPKMAIYLLPVGYLSAAALHGAWDAADTVSQNGFVVLGLYLFLALLSYALLGGAMFKAREIPVGRA